MPREVRPRLLWVAAAVSLLTSSGTTAVAFGQGSENPSQASQLPKPPPPQGGSIPRQEENKQTPTAVPDERWNLFWQATSVGQYHGTFPSPYKDPQFSLQDYPERDVSLTTTLFLGLRLDQNTHVYFNPEIAGGKGFSGVTGLANSSNGELPRVASATPRPYLARLYLSHDFGFGSRKESFESEENQLGGQRPLIRYTVTVGRFTLTDFFDNNRYTHDPRTQFLGWAVMFNGAWDYPADVRGYTWGWVHELHTVNWSFRYGSGAMPRVANGLRFDRRVLRDRGDVFEVERRHEFRKHPGTIRLLGYANHADAGVYGDAIRLGKQNGTAPDIATTRRPGTLKYGFGINAEQEITSDVGVFSRLGWNDGKTESFAFTAIDRLATGGVSMTGHRWHRPYDTGASEFTARSFGCTCFVPGFGRARLPTRGRTPAIRSRIQLGKLLQRAGVSRIFRKSRLPAGSESCVQPGPGPSLHLFHPPALGTRQRNPGPPVGTIARVISTPIQSRNHKF